MLSLWVLSLLVSFVCVPADYYLRPTPTEKLYHSSVHTLYLPKPSSALYPSSRPSGAPYPSPHPTVRPPPPPDDCSFDSDPVLFNRESAIYYDDGSYYFTAAIFMCHRGRHIPVCSKALEVNEQELICSINYATRGTYTCIYYPYIIFPIYSTRSSCW